MYAINFFPLSQVVQAPQVFYRSRSLTGSSVVSLLPGPTNIRLHPLVRKVGRLRHFVIQHGCFLRPSPWLSVNEGRPERFSAWDEKGELFILLFLVSSTISLLLQHSCWVNTKLYALELDDCWIVYCSPHQVLNRVKESPPTIYKIDTP